MLRLFSVVIIMVLNFVLFSAMASGAAGDKYFELREVSSLDMVQLWNTPARHETMQNGTAVIRHTVFDQGINKRLGFKKVPILVVLVGRNQTDYEPRGYILFSEKEFLYSLEVSAPKKSGDIAFSISVSERDCSSCIEGGFVILDNGREFRIVSEDVDLNMDR